MATEYDLRHIRDMHDAGVVHWHDGPDGTGNPDHTHRATGGRAEMLAAYESAGNHPTYWERDDYQSGA